MWPMRLLINHSKPKLPIDTARNGFYTFLGTYHINGRGQVKKRSILCFPRKAGHKPYSCHWRIADVVVFIRNTLPVFLIPALNPIYLSTRVSYEKGYHSLVSIFLIHNRKRLMLMRQQTRSEEC